MPSPHTKEALVWDNQGHIVPGHVPRTVRDQLIIILERIDAMDDHFRLILERYTPLMGPPLPTRDTFPAGVDKGSPDSRDTLRSSSHAQPLNTRDSSTPSLLSASARAKISYQKGIMPYPIYKGSIELPEQADPMQILSDLERAERECWALIGIAKIQKRPPMTAIGGMIGQVRMIKEATMKVRARILLEEEEQRKAGEIPAQWKELQTRILAALAPYPEARAAVLEAIQAKL